MGHLARAAVAEARAAGIDLPRNAQGFAASRIAGGADPASVFAALVAPPEAPAVDDIVPPADDPSQVDDLPAEGAPLEPPDPPDGPPVGGELLVPITPAEAALILLSGGEG